MKLFVDDIRRCPDGWELARNVTKAIRILATMPIEEVSLDHDIQCSVQTSDNWIEHLSPEDFTAVAHYIAAMPDDIRPKTVYVHTANPRGAIRIMDILKDKVPNLQRNLEYYYELRPENKPDDFQDH